MERITLGEEHIESIGLVLEPNFFRIHCYSDLEGANFVKTISCSRDRHHDFSELQSKNHLFALNCHPHWTIVPAAIFREEDMSRYLELNTGFTRGGLPTYSPLDGLESVLIYPSDEEAEKLVRQVQPALEIKHVENTLLEYGRRKVSEKKEDLLLIQVFDDLAMVNIFKEGSLLLANSIEVAKTEDLVYYVFYILKKLKISTGIQTELDGYGTLLPGITSQLSKFLTNFNKAESSHLAVIIPQCA